jgi:hypothetical protein
MAEAWKEVRVFISSTFKDMQAERDHLVRFVFPLLREELLRRRAHFVDVDLRWGVTGDQDAFDLCMDEIDRCHPRFICMLGGRYGWMPPPKEVPQDFMPELLAGNTPAGALTAEQRDALTDLYARDGESGVYRLRVKPAAKADVEVWGAKGKVAVDVLQRAKLAGAERSITASEAHYGALERLDKPTFRYFYFRDPDVTNSIPEPLAEDYREKAGSFAGEALEALKARVRDERTEGLVLTAPGREEKRKMPHYTYPCRWDPDSKRIVDLWDFGQRVYRDLRESIFAEFGDAPPEELGVFAEENAALEAFIETRLERYVVGGREPVLETLHAHAEASGGNAYLCLEGDPGSGKTALLAKFYRDYLHHVGDRGADDVLVVPHFIGVNSTNVREMLRRLCHELADAAGIAEEIPADYDGLRDAFPKYLEQAAGTKRVLLIIDAVNQLDATHNASSMTWLPDRLPENVRVIMSALPGPALDALKARAEAPSKTTLEALRQEDSTAIMEKFLHRYRKTLDEEQRGELLAKQDAGNPLYLLTALEELRTLGTYEEITDRIRELPEQVQPLFAWILQRLEGDPGFRDEQGREIGRDLVRRYTSYLSLGRSGMAQAELVDLIAPAADQEGARPDPQGNVAALRALLLPYLMRRGELLDFYHGQTRAAVQNRYLQDESDRLAANRQIADYFRRQADPAADLSWTGDSLRGLSELPFHLTEAAEWEKVHDVLTNFRFLERKAAEVGIVETADAEGKTSKMYTGVLQLQDDFTHALEKMPGGAAAARRPIIVTATDFGDGLVIRCPFCNRSTPFNSEWLGQKITCPQEGCDGPLKVNPFVVERPG